MWPLDLPAHEVLKLPGQTVTPWAVFDWQWYLRTYPDVTTIVQDDDPTAILNYYLDHGQTRGHSPNRLFDEQWHRASYPQIADRVAAGHCRSAFDAYCRRGALDRSAHWLFDELAYRERYPELTNDVLAEYGMSNRYDHYLRHGCQEDRIGHVMFDPAVYLANFDPADVPAICAEGVFQHYLDRLEAGAPELRTSVYFDPAWYITRYPEVGRHIVAKRWKCALHHYLCNDTPTAFDPSEDFSEAWYLRCDPGLLKVIEARSFRNGYMHFLRFGTIELRAPTGSIDLVWYAAQPAVQSDLQQGRAPDAYTHWLTIGSAAGLAAANSEPSAVSDAQARRLSRQAAAALLPIAGRFGYAFDCDADVPAVSVIMVVRNGFASTMATIASLRSNMACGIELIIVDCGSDDETGSIEQYVPGAKIVRFQSEVGWSAAADAQSDISWSRAADAGCHLARAPAILFLSCEALIAPGSVKRACVRLTTDRSVGAIGGMILQPHGTVAHAGGILWNDGDTSDYRRGASPLSPEVNFVRDVDFCAPAFLLVRSALFSQLDGFDHDCTPGHETVDLCLRIAQAGFRVVYDPSVMVTVDDAATSTADPGAGDPGAHFRGKHAAVLAERFAPGAPNQAFARHAGATPPRVLFIEDTVPLRRIGSGFVRANDLVQVMALLGYAVTMFPVNVCHHHHASVFADMPEQVEVMHDLSLEHLAAFLQARPNYYDIVWVARTHNLVRVRPILDRLTAASALKARIVLDTEAIAPFREAMQAELTGVPYDLSAAIQAILANAETCQHVVAVTAAEADALQSYGLPRVSVIGHMIEPNPTAQPFAERAGMLFVGAIHQDDSPNLDSLVWFVDQVLPLIEAELQWETRLTIAGYLAPGIDLSRFAHHPRITLSGPVANLEPLYNRHRVFVAPTRYAAGAPYKVLEAAANGLPVVATELLRGELDWRSGPEIIAADAGDPAMFAACVVRLYRDETLWQVVRDGALNRLRQDHGQEDYARAVALALAPSPGQ